ncbi:MAG: hypothetical protein ACLP70_14520 [Streptosporangiaceae bacterium]
MRPSADQVGGNAGQCARRALAGRTRTRALSDAAAGYARTRLSGEFRLPGPAGRGASAAIGRGRVRRAAP